MSVLKFRPMIFAAAVVTAISVLLPTVTLAQSTNYRFEAGSLFTFNSGLAGAQQFDLSGTFTLNEDPITATITNAVLGLSSLPGNLPITPPSVTDLLEDDVFALSGSTGSQTVYQSTAFDFPFDVINPYSITIDNSSANRLATFSGLGSQLPFPIIADGTSFEFAATAVVVPEPTGLPVCLLLAITFIIRRKHGDSSSLA